MGTSHARILILLLSISGLPGCGISVPDIKEPWDADRPADAETPRIPGTAQIEFEIKKRIYCDLKDAVLAANQIPLKQSSPRGGKETIVQHGLIPSSWGAQVSLSLTVEETSSLNPGLGLLNALPNVISYPARALTPSGPLPATISSQSFNLGFGATLSSTATRVDKFDPYYSIPFLLIPETTAGVCFPGPPYTQNDPLVNKGWSPAVSSPFVVESDLGIKDWLVGAMMVDNSLPSEGASGVKDTVSLEIKFVIITSGNVTPTWKLVRVAANTGSTPLFNMGRTRTHDLIITIGAPTPGTRDTHLASQIGNAVSNANRALLAPPASQ